MTDKQAAAKLRKAIKTIHERDFNDQTYSGRNAITANPKMDAIDTAQQRQIDGLIFGFSFASFLLVIWCACLTFAIINAPK